MDSSHQPLVSIIMPCFNGEKTLPRALASLINQTYENWELIFIDDGSTDGSVDVVQAAHDPRIRIIRFERNLGRGVARQKGNEEAKGEFMAMLDADDWWYSTKLEKQLSFLMGHPSISLVGTGLMVVDHAGRVLACRRCRRIDSAIMTTLKRPPLAYGTLCIRSETARGYRYHQRYQRGQDRDFMQRMCLEHRFANLAEPLYVYTEDENLTWEKINRRYWYRLRSLIALSPRFPLLSMVEMGRSTAEMVIFNLILALGMGQTVTRWRSIYPFERMLAVHEHEKRMVESTASRLFGDYPA